MIPPPAQIVQRLKRKYPRPSIDPDWLEGCYTWIREELHLTPENDMEEIMKHVEEQLLQSDFTDSMLAGTGFPPGITNADETLLEGPILVEVTGIMEIGQSAYSLMQIYESRIEYRRQAQLRIANGDEDPGEQKPIPKYPRSMLQLELSDGASVLTAVEVKKLPELELGETPLGYKMIIGNVPVRRGTAHLQPDRVQLLGRETAGRDEQRDAMFLRALKRRLGEPVDDEPEPEPAPVNAPPAPVPAAVHPNTPPRPRAHPPDSVSPVSRSPLRDLSPHASEAEAGPSGAPRKTLHEHDDDAGQPRRRKRPSRVGRSPSLEPPPREAVVQSSRYFSRNAAGANGTAGTSNGAASAGLDDEDAGRVRVDSGDANAMHNLKRAIGLSPPRAAPASIPDGGSEEEEEDFFNPTTRASSKGKGKEKAELSFGEAGSEDYPFDFEMDDSFLEQISRVEHEAYLRQEPSPKTNGRLSVQPPPSQPVAQQVKAEPCSQFTTRTLFNATSTAVGARRSAASSRAASAAPLEVIDISDDDEVEGDKENVPAPTRHVRRRVAPVVEDVIELSD